MFPPVDNAVLQNNPEFAVVYGTLTTVILNTNGSTKNEPAAKERDAIREVRRWLTAFWRTFSDRHVES